MRNRSYEIALCGVTVAGGTIFLALASYLPVARLGMLACATVVLFLPFSMNFFGGGVLSFAATALLAFFVGGGNGPVIALAYVCFFGLQPMLIYAFRRFRGLRRLPVGQLHRRPRRREILPDVRLVG